MRVLGVDPGTKVTGYGIVDRAGARRGHLIECGVVRTTSAGTLSARLAEIYAALHDLILRHEPHVLAIETVFYGKNVRSALALGQAQGVVLLLGEQLELDVVEYAPAVIKSTVVGSGRAEKAQVGIMVARLLKLERPPTPSDAADGVAVALTHIMRQP